MLAWGFGDFKGGEIFPWRNYPLRNCPRAKFPPPLYGKASTSPTAFAESPAGRLRCACVKGHLGCNPLPHLGGVFAERGHSALTVPIITLLIMGTPLKTTHLQKCA